MSEPEAKYHVPEPQHPARTVLANGSPERFEEPEQAAIQRKFRRAGMSEAHGEATEARAMYSKEQLDQWRSFGPEREGMLARLNAANSFGAKVQVAISQWIAVGHPDPTHLYLGSREREALADATRYSGGAFLDAPGPGNTIYMGLIIVRVAEPSFFRVG